MSSMCCCTARERDEEKVDSVQKAFERANPRSDGGTEPLSIKQRATEVLNAAIEKGHEINDGRVSKHDALLASLALAVIAWLVMHPMAMKVVVVIAVVIGSIEGWKYTQRKTPLLKAPNKGTMKDGTGVDPENKEKKHLGGGEEMKHGDEASWHLGADSKVDADSEVEKVLDYVVNDDNKRNNNGSAAKEDMTTTTSPKTSQKATRQASPKQSPKSGSTSGLENKKKQGKRTLA